MPPPRDGQPGSPRQRATELKPELKTDQKTRMAMRAQLASQRAALDAERARTVRLVNKALSPRQCAPTPLFSVAVLH